MTIVELLGRLQLERFEFRRSSNDASLAVDGFTLEGRSDGWLIKHDPIGEFDHFEEESYACDTFYALAWRYQPPLSWDFPFASMRIDAECAKVRLATLQAAGGAEKLADLDELLEAEGVPEAAYRLDGDRIQAFEGFVLAKIATRWVIDYCERGGFVPTAFFESLDAACSEISRLLRRDFARVDGDR